MTAAVSSAIGLRFLRPALVSAATALGRQPGAVNHERAGNRMLPPGTHQRHFTSGACTSYHLEPAPVRIALVDEDRVQPGHPRPAGDRGDDRWHSRQLGRRFHPALELAADNALMDEHLADL